MVGRMKPSEMRSEGWHPQCRVGKNLSSLRAVSAGLRSASRVDSSQALEVFK